MDLNVYVVDDDAAVRDSLKILFEAHGFTVHVFPDGEVFLNENLMKISGPVLLDVRMPGRDGLEVLTAALGINPDLAIIIMSGHGDIPMAVRALRKGARSFIEKPFKPADVLKEFARAKRDLASLETEKTEHADMLVKLSKLTPREKQVMDLLVQGKPNKIVAADLDLSVRTIETHRAHLLSKLDVRSLSDLVRVSLLFE